MQAKIADQLQLRYTPVLTFALDDGVKRSVEVSRLLRELEDNESDGGNTLESDDRSASTEGTTVD